MGENVYMEEKRDEGNRSKYKVRDKNSLDQLSAPKKSVPKNH